MITVFQSLYTLGDTPLKILLESTTPKMFVAEVKLENITDKSVKTIDFHRWNIKSRNVSSGGFLCDMFSCEKRALLERCVALFQLDIAAV